MPETTFMPLEPHAHELASACLEWLDLRWDGNVKLLEMNEHDDPRVDASGYFVRPTAWYALGLLMRRSPGDRERAISAIETVLEHQFHVPGAPYHGTWRRSRDEADPPADAVKWRDYDPNWREFIGTTLALILIEFEPILPVEIVEKIDRALVAAAEGSIERRVRPTYTNVALMSAFLCHFAGEREAQPGWSDYGEMLGLEVLDDFRSTGAFAEYNSPTYYGVDLYALGLWRGFSSSPELRRAGAELEASLWREIAAQYHPVMNNICGPYDRAYGMDMRRYVSLLGLWIWIAIGRDRAPVPPLSSSLEHAWDLAFGPLFALVGSCVPGDVTRDLVQFSGQRVQTTVISRTPDRISTVWISDRLMVGAEDAGRGKRSHPQFHPATIHWLLPDGEVGWIAVRGAECLDAMVEAERLTVRSKTSAGEEPTICCEILAQGLDGSLIAPERWSLPGLEVHVAQQPVMAFETSGDDASLILTYTFVPSEPLDEVELVLAPHPRWD